MRRRWVPRAALALLVSAGTLTVTEREVTSVHASDESPCKEQLILLLIDQSQSLRKNDKANARREAADALIETLSATSVPVSLALAGFGNDYEPVVERDVNGQPLLESDGSPRHQIFRFGDVGSEAAEQTAFFAKVNIEEITKNTDSQNTDYVAALLGATRFFALQQEADDASSRCRNLVWFTDGAYEIDVQSPATGKYTTTPSSTSSGRQEIEDEFGSRICTELQVSPPSLLEQSVSESIRDAEFAVTLIDLQGTGSQEKRARTKAVIDKLFSGDEECGIEGKVIDVTNAGSLIGNFFAEAQPSANRVPTDCERLEKGVPDSLIRSLAVLADSSSAVVRITSGAEVVDEGKRTLTYPAPDVDRPNSGSIAVSVENGALTSCFIDAAFGLEQVSADSVYEGAASATVAVRAVGTALGESSVPLNDEFVQVTIEANGEPLDVRFDIATQRFVASLEGPFEGDITVNAAGTLRIAKRSAVLESWVMTSVDRPSPPILTWQGEKSLEGDGEIRGVVIVDSGADFEDGSQVCASFKDSNGELEILAKDDDTPFGTVLVQGDLERCQNGKAEPMIFDVVVTFPEAVNKEGSVNLTPRTSFRSLGETDELVPEQLEVTFTIAKPAKTGAGVLFATLLALAVAMVSYVLLFLAAWFQGKLQDPGRLLIAEADVRLEAASGGRSRLQAVGRFQSSDLKRVTQDGSGYAVGPLSIKRTWPFNPLAEIHAVLTCKDGAVVCDPSMSKTAKPGRRAAIPTRFDQLVAAHIHEGQSRLYVLMRAGATSDDFQRAMDLSLPRLEQRIRAVLTDGKRSDRSAIPVTANGDAVTADRGSSVPSVPGAGASADATPPRPPRPPLPPSRSQER